MAVPAIQFSNECDTDALLSVLYHLRLSLGSGPVFTFALADGRVIEGSYVDHNDTFVRVAKISDGRSTGDVAIFDADDLVGVIYL